MSEEPTKEDKTPRVRSDGYRDRNGNPLPGNLMIPIGMLGGRPRSYADPQELWDKCVEYFQWIQDHPLFEVKLVSYEGNHELKPVPKMRVMTIGGLQLFLGISHTTWQDYRTKPEFSAICEVVDKHIREQKFSGATSGFFNATIIARDLGLVDKTESKVEQTTTNVNIDVDDAQEASRVYQQLMAGDGGEGSGS